MLRDTGRYDHAEQAIRQGLKLCDPCEPLYIEWARLEQARCRTDRIPKLWCRLQQRHAHDADEIAGNISTPATETELAFTASSTSVIRLRCPTTEEIAHCVAYYQPSDQTGEPSVEVAVAIAILAIASCAVLAAWLLDDGAGRNEAEHDEYIPPPPY